MSGACLRSVHSFENKSTMTDAVIQTVVKESVGTGTEAGEGQNPLFDRQVALSVCRQQTAFQYYSQKPRNVGVEGGDKEI